METDEQTDTGDLVSAFLQLFIASTAETYELMLFITQQVHSPQTPPTGRCYP
jgi:hypothetical protein